MLAEGSHHILCVVSDIGDSGYSQVVEPLCRSRSDREQLPDLPAGHQFDELLAGTDFEETVGLHLLTGDLGRRHAVGDSDRACESHLLPGPALDLPCHLGGPVEVPCGRSHIKKRFVEGYGLGHGGIRVPDTVKLFRYGLVFLEIRVDVNPLRTEAVCLLDIHTGTHPEAPRFVAAGGYHSSLIGKRPNDDGLPFQRGIVADLD